MLKRICVVLFAYLVFATSAAAQVMVYIPQVPEAHTGNTKNIHSVAIISVIGSHFALRNRQFISTKSKELDISDWKIDEQISSTLRRYLSSRFTIKDTTYDREALIKIKANGFNSGRRFYDYLRKIPAGGIDAFLFVRTALPELGVEGLGLDHDQQLVNKPPVLWANYEITLIDARTQKTIASAFSRLPSTDGRLPSFPALVGPNEMKLDNALEPDETQRAALRAGVYTLMPVTLLETLRAMKLGVELPTADAAALPGLWVLPDRSRAL